MSLQVLAHKTGWYFRVYILNHNSLSHQTWPIDRYKHFQESFEQFGGIRLSFGPFSIHQIT